MQSPAINDSDLLRIIDNQLARGVERAGTHLACRIGCTSCCIGPFPINALDAERLRKGLHTIAPERAEQLIMRARQAAAEIGGNWRDEQDVFERCAALPCPALDPDTGACELYEFRPIACRTYGPPVRIGDEDLPPCELCFRGGSPQEIEACRIEIEDDGIEEILLDALSDQEDTLVALAITAAADSPDAC